MPASLQRRENSKVVWPSGHLENQHVGVGDEIEGVWWCIDWTQVTVTAKKSDNKLRGILFICKVKHNFLIDLSLLRPPGRFFDTSSPQDAQSAQSGKEHFLIANVLSHFSGRNRAHSRKRLCRAGFAGSPHQAAPSFTGALPRLWRTSACFFLVPI